MAAEATRTHTADIAAAEGELNRSHTTAEGERVGEFLANVVRTEGIAHTIVVSLYAMFMCLL